MQRGEISSTIKLTKLSACLNNWFASRSSFTKQLRLVQCKVEVGWKEWLCAGVAKQLSVSVNLTTVMALGPLHTGKSGESKGSSPTESTQTAEIIENGKEKLRNKARRVVRSRGRLEGESRNIKCLDPQGLGRRFFSPVGKALRIWLKNYSLPGNHVRFPAWIRTGGQKFLFRSLSFKAYKTYVTVIFTHLECTKTMFF